MGGLCAFLFFVELDKNAHILVGSTHCHNNSPNSLSSLSFLPTVYRGGNNLEYAEQTPLGSCWSFFITSFSRRLSATGSMDGAITSATALALPLIRQFLMHLLRRVESMSINEVPLRPRKLLLERLAFCNGC